MSASPGAVEGLAALEARLRRELAVLDGSNRPWLPARRTRAGEPVASALIIGGGQSGLGVAFGLRRAAVDGVVVVDANPRGLAGPWLRFARMRTLRTPKSLVGIDHGVPSLTFRGWYEAQFGAASWEALEFIPRELWPRYLDWYRSVLDLPVRDDTVAGAIQHQAEDDCFAVPLTRDGRTEVLHARTVVLASGIEGSGSWATPDLIRRALPRSCYAHTSEAIDFERLRGRVVAILGGAASAFDNAILALEAGAEAVHLCFRRPAMVRVDAFQWADFTGFLRHHVDLPDDLRYRFMRRIFDMGQLPPANTWRAATAHTNFHLHPDSPWRAVEMDGGRIRIETPRGALRADFVIAATGYVTDLALRPELARLHPLIARWSDRFSPPPDEARADLLAHPYLDRRYGFMAREPGAAPWLGRIFCYNYGALVSHGYGVSGLTGLQHSLERVVDGVTGRLYAEDAEAHLSALCAFDRPDF